MPNVIEEVKDADGNVIRRRVKFFTTGPSRTKQSMKAECDINGIMKRYERTGVITHLAQRQAYFADVSEVPDFAAALESVRKAEDMFMSLPAKIRKEFGNDAGAYVEFCSDPANRDRMVELGILDKPEEVKPVEVVVTNPAPAPEGGV
nr:MAG: internal scaffolding protein [Microvirus sp.]